ncbi:MAG: universal stress protein [Chloroflexi bacterium]|nr:universal stress protein [Chloroflexota bacterium]MBP7041279.1 universal stress protein [Chloroflexota bacterium]
MNFRKILVPLDGSELAERVVLPAIRIAEGVKAQVVLLTVVMPTPRPDRPGLVERAVQTSKYEAGLYLKSVRSHYLPATVEVVTAVTTGQPANAIIAYVQENDVDLILMTTHGRSGLTRWSYGRVAEKVLRRAPCPTVILRSHQQIVPEGIKRILVPLDGSRLAEQALPPAHDIAAALGAEIVLLQAIEPMLPFPFSAANVAEEVETSPVWEYLTRVRIRLQAGGVTTQAEVVVGPVADAVIDYADSHQVDLIVLSSLGSSGFQMWVFGSVAERVMQGAHCATMVIRQEETAQED